MLTQADFVMILFFPVLGGIFAYIIIFELWDEYKNQNK